jgi:thiol-disulfide isomerase/thioredoxin
VGTIQEPALDIRNPTAITQLSANSQSIYGHAWLNLIDKGLGNGVTTKLESGEVGDEDAKITATANHPEKVNDYGSTAGYSTKVGSKNGGALYDYSTTATPANVTHSFFFVYDKDGKVTPEGSSTAQPAKIASWVDLTDKGSASAADVGTAITTVGAANLTSLDQFAWWKSSINARQLFTSTTDGRGGKVPVITDAVNAASEGGWRINQVTYPELVDLLKSGANTANAVILFGGTWCPNTRPVLPAVNKYAQENNVTVFNFDTVLDGSTVGGLATSPVNPLQTRNTAAYQSTPNANPTFLYGDVVDQYLTNIKTQYTPTGSGASPVTYFKGGGSAATTSTTRKLQVPFVIGYQGKAGDEPNGGVTRQWIIDNGNNTYTEYMSQWWLTNPQPSQLGLSATQLPQGAPIWSTINAQLASLTWQTNPATLTAANTAVDTDDAQYLVDTDKANVTYDASGAGSVSASSSATGAVVISPAALAAALSTLGASAPANNAAAKTAYVAAQKATPQDSALIANLTTIVGAWGVAQSRKNTHNNLWGNATNPRSVIGGLAAVHALDVFFGGLPGGVVSRRTVTAKPVPFGTAPKVSISIANDYGRVPAGNLSLVVKKAGATVASASTAVADNAASFTLPVLDAGTYDYALSYPGDDQIAGFTEAGSLTVEPVQNVVVDPPVTTPVVIAAPGPKPPSTTVTLLTASKVKGAVSKAPTSKKAGKYTVTITTPKGASAASGKVTIKLKKGKTTKTITGKLSKGVVTFSVPKLARGTWKVAISWPGDSKYLAASATGASIRVTK